jgi:hypothetical protein
MTNYQKVFSFVVITILCLLALTISAKAHEVQCGPRDLVVQYLEQKWNERQKVTGVSQDNIVMELYASEETGTWTIVMSNVDGTSCLIASGRGFSNTNLSLPPNV